MWLGDMGQSEHLAAGWRGQYDRVLRWHSRVTSLGSRDDATISPTTAFDYLYAFFQNCYHLRDWLENDGAISDRRLQSFMTGNVELAVCRDIANGTKHFRIQSPSIDSTPAIVREYHPVGWPGKRPGTSESYAVILEDRRSKVELLFDLQDLANRCVSSWRGLLQAEGLL